MFCRFRDVFGRPRVGMHRLRIPGLDVAVVDALGTVLVALALARWRRWHVGLTLLGALLAAIVAHRLFCVNTRLNVALFGRV